MMKRHLFSVSCLTWFVFFLVLAGDALAHFLWLNPNTYAPAPGKGIGISFGFGHAFPYSGEFLEREAIESVSITAPDGKRSNISLGNGHVVYQIPPLPSQTGTYMISAIKKGGYFTKTAGGVKPVPKSQAEGAITSVFLSCSSKALLAVGTPGGKGYAGTNGTDMEIVPLEDPTALKPGAYLPVRLLLRGKPLADTFVYATYDGFSPWGKIAFAYSTKTDGEGIARFRLDKRGVWLILARHKATCPDPALCDNEILNTTLTFEIP